MSEKVHVQEGNSPERELRFKSKIKFKGKIIFILGKLASKQPFFKESVAAHQGKYISL